MSNLSPKEESLIKSEIGIYGKYKYFHHDIKLGIILTHPFT